MSDANEKLPGGKGKPTPTRAEAEAARKAQMKRPATRRDQKIRARNERRRQQAKQRDALYGEGRAEDLPLRDRGRAREIARAVVDRRRTVAEFMLPVLMFVLFLSFVQDQRAYYAVMTIWFTIVTALVIDSIFLRRQLKRALREKLGDDEVKGHTLYTIMRSTQIRRFRLPKPAVKIGDPIP